MKERPFAHVASAIWFSFVFSRSPRRSGLILLAGILFFGSSLSAQRNLALYQLPLTPVANTLNPGKIPGYSFYLGLPVGGNLNLLASNNGFSIGDLGLKKGSSFWDSDFDRLLKEAQGANLAFGGIQVDWVHAGLRVKDHFFSVQVSDHIQGQGEYSDALVELLRDIDTGFIGEKTYDLSGLHLDGMHYRSFALGYARPVGDQLSVGGKVKFLSGLFSFWTMNQGFRLINSGDNPFFGVEGSLDVLATGVDAFSDETITRYLTQYLWGSGNYGIAFDIGLNYRLSPELELFGSALNLGFIKWKSKIDYKVLDQNFLIQTNNIDSLQETLDRVVDDISDGSVPSEVAYRTPLVKQLYAGGNYWFKPGHGVGVVLHSRIFNDQVSWGGAVSYQGQLKDWLGWTANYSVYPKSFVNVGAGVSARIGPLQLHLVTDNVPALISLDKASNAQVSAGIHLVFGRGGSKEEKEEKEPAPVHIPGYRTGKKETAAGKDTTPPPAASPAEKEPVSSTGLPDLGPGPYFTIAGNVKDKTTQGQVKGVLLEVYRVKEDGSEELFYSRGFYGGYLKAQLPQGKPYLLRIIKMGFHPLELPLTPEQTEEETMEEQEFLLERLFEPNPPSRKPSADIAAPARSEEARPVGGTAQPAVEGARFRVIQRTSFRKGPYHTYGVILRFPVGAEVELIEKTEESWWKVRYDGKEGWVKSFLLEAFD